MIELQYGKDEVSSSNLDEGSILQGTEIKNATIIQQPEKNRLDSNKHESSFFIFLRTLSNLLDVLFFYTMSEKIQKFGEIYDII